MTKSTPPSNLRKLLVEQVRDLHWAELQLRKTLPRKAAKAERPELRRALLAHAVETATHVTRLIEVARHLASTTRPKPCEAMKGLLLEGDELWEEFAGSDAGDASLICAARKVEHYEIASYQTVVALAGALGEKRVEALLNQTLREETAADDLLCTLAESANHPAPPPSARPHPQTRARPKRGGRRGQPSR